ncbi:MAG: hypothetical protein KIT77_25535 [Caldilinea sp.]|nr:hypothetical protein [Caldilinea sp.]
MKRLSGSVLRLLLVGVLGWIALPLIFLQPEPTSASPAASKAEPSSFAVETIAVLPETGVASPLPLPNATEDARLWRYSFREPRVIFTHDSIIGVAGWLPDSRNLTLILNDTTSLGFEQIRTIDVVTGRTQSFGNRLNLFREDHPAWLADVGKMAFRGTDKLVEGGVAPPYHLWLAEAGTTKLITPTLRGITASSGGDHWVIATRRNQSRPVLVNAATGQKQIVQVDLQEYGIDVNNIYVQMAWHPSLPKVAVFDPNGFVVINLKDNHVSVIDLGKDADEYHGYDKRWAFDARWSLDGQRMALITTARLPILTYSELTVLDMTTGKHTNFVFDHQYKYVTSLTWAPDSETLLASVVIDNNGGYDRLGLILVDAATGVSRRILPDSTFYGGQFSFGVEWSPDGKTVAVYCPTENEGRVCTIEVSTVPTQIRLEGIQEMGSGVNQTRIFAATIVDATP